MAASPIDFSMHYVLRSNESPQAKSQAMIFTAPQNTALFDDRLVNIEQVGLEHMNLPVNITKACEMRKVRMRYRFVYKFKTESKDLYGYTEDNIPSHCISPWQVTIFLLEHLCSAIELQSTHTQKQVTARTTYLLGDGAFPDGTLRIEFNNKKDTTVEEDEEEVEGSSEPFLKKVKTSRWSPNSSESDFDIIEEPLQFSDDSNSGEYGDPPVEVLKEIIEVSICCTDSDFTYTGDPQPKTDYPSWDAIQDPSILSDILCVHLIAVPGHFTRTGLNIFTAPTKFVKHRSISYCSFEFPFGHPNAFASDLIDMKYCYVMYEGINVKPTTVLNMKLTNEGFVKSDVCPRMNKQKVFTTLEVDQNSFSSAGVLTIQAWSAFTLRKPHAPSADLIDPNWFQTRGRAALEAIYKRFSDDEIVTIQYLPQFILYHSLSGNNIQPITQYSFEVWIVNSIDEWFPAEMKVDTRADLKLTFKI